jgi:enterochelin esterase-like enzyme
MTLRSRPASSHLHTFDPRRRRWLGAGVAALGLGATWSTGVRAQGRAAPDIFPTVTAGHIDRLESLRSPHVDARHVDVWLPTGYTPDKRYAVVYMHDGQMLYDPVATWNFQAWQVDAVATRLLEQQRVRDFIVVGIWSNGKKRGAEYFPQKFLQHLLPNEVRNAFVQEMLSGQPLSDAYLRFIVDTVKPAVDSRYATVTDASGTFIAGASLGGLVSIYAMCEYPNVFGGCAALSTHWIGRRERNERFPNTAIAYLREALPPPARRRIYMDRGTVGLDAQYDEAHARIDGFMRERGWQAPNLVSRVVDGEGHEEKSWQRRLPVALETLLAR